MTGVNVISVYKTIGLRGFEIIESADVVLGVPA